MIFNYLKISIRNLFRQRFYSLINIFGLAIGVSCTMLIGIYVIDELSFDNFHPQLNNIFKVNSTLEQSQKITTGFTSIEVGPYLVKNDENIETFCRLMPLGNNQTVKSRLISSIEENIYLVDSSFFQIFGFKLLQGSENLVLNENLSVVLTKRLADKYFENEDVLGQEIIIRNKVYTITGIAEDPPRNSDIQFNALVSFNSFPEEYYKVFAEDWFRISTLTYVKTKKPNSQQTITNTLNKLIKTDVSKFIDENDLEGKISFEVLPISKVHFDNTKEFDNPKGNFKYILIFSTVAFFILIIACINFVNLSLAQFSKRFKEIGVRKTLGASNNQIALQFLIESFILTFISILVSYTFLDLGLPIFNKITGKDYFFIEFFIGDLIWINLGILFFVGLLAGSYPAFVQSRFNPVMLFRSPRIGFANIGVVRRVLVIIQFAFSTALIITTLVVYSQFVFIQKTDLGFQKESILVAELPNDTSVVKNIPEIKNQLSSINGVNAISVVSNLPNGNQGELLFRVEQDSNKLTERGVKYMAVDEHFIKMMGINLLFGRNFDPKNENDYEEGFLINEAAAKTFNWIEPVGKRIQWGLMANNQASSDGKVIGVISNFNFNSLHKPIEPLILLYRKTGGLLLNINIGKENLASSKIKVEENLKKIIPNYEINVRFINSDIAKLYQTEEKTLAILGYFSFMSLLIACLGLFALTSYLVEQKTKEIGIRKILGASASNTTWFISKEFFFLITIGFLIAAPTTFYALNIWLTTFAYKVGINPLFFGFSIAVALTLSGVTIVYHILKISRTNPVEALRYN